LHEAEFDPKVARAPSRESRDGEKFDHPELSVTVVDERGSAVPGAEVTLRGYGSIARLPPAKGSSDESGRCLLRPHGPGVYSLQVDSADHRQYRTLIDLPTQEHNVVLESGPRLILSVPAQLSRSGGVLRVQQRRAPGIRFREWAVEGKLEIDAGIWASGLLEVWSSGAPGHPEKLALRVGLPESGVVRVELPAKVVRRIEVEVSSSGAVVNAWRAQVQDVRVATASRWREVDRHPSEAVGRHRIELIEGESHLRVSADGYETAIVAVPAQLNGPLKVTISRETTLQLTVAEEGAKSITVGLVRGRDAVSGDPIKPGAGAVSWNGATPQGGSAHRLHLALHRELMLPAAILISLLDVERSVTLRGLPAHSTLRVLVPHSDGRLFAGSFTTGEPGTGKTMRVEWEEEPRRRLLLLDAGGKALSNWRVQVLSNKLLGTVTTDPRGRIELIGDEHRVAPLRLGVSNASGYVELAVDGPNTGEWQELRLPAVAKMPVQCRIVDARGQAVPGHLVSFCIIEGPSISAFTDEDGVAKAQIPKTRQRILAVAYPYEGSSAVMAHIHSGAARLKFPEPLWHLNLKVELSRARAEQIVVEIAEKSGRVVESTELLLHSSTVLDFDGLKPGAYVARVRGRAGTQEQEFEISRGVIRSSVYMKVE